jgi:hypothetical protein
MIVLSWTRLTKVSYNNHSIQDLNFQQLIKIDIVYQAVK